MRELHAANVAVFALSYDAVAVLRRFADHHAITYPLLSDEGSVVIERLGLLNRHTAEQHAFFGSQLQERHRRLPYPGTFVLDEAGVVTARSLDQSYRERPGAGYLFRQATGRAARAARSATASSGPVEITAWLDSTTFRPLQLLEVHVDLRIADGWHVYTPPVPPGFTPLSAALEPHEGLATEPAEVPQGRPFTVEGLPESFFVADGDVRLSVPFRLAGAAFAVDGRNLADPGAPKPVELTVDVRFQVCSDVECMPPQAQRVPLVIDEEGRVMP